MNQNRDYKHIELLERDDNKLSRLEFLATIHHDQKLLVLLKNFILPYQHPEEVREIINILEDENIHFFDWGISQLTYNSLYLIT